MNTGAQAELARCSRLSGLAAACGPPESWPWRGRGWGRPPLESPPERRGHRCQGNGGGAQVGEEATEAGGQRPT